MDILANRMCSSMVEEPPNITITRSWNISTKIESIMNVDYSLIILPKTNSLILTIQIYNASTKEPVFSDFPKEKYILVEDISSEKALFSLIQLNQAIWDIILITNNSISEIIKHLYSISQKFFY